MYAYVVRYSNGEISEGTTQTVSRFSDNLWKFERKAREMGCSIESFDVRRCDG